MAAPIPRRTVELLLLIVLSCSMAACAVSIGVNYGALGNNLPPPADVARFLKERTLIDRVKLFDSNPDFIRAFAGTGIALMITVPNDDIPSLAASRHSPPPTPAAVAWVAAHVAPFYPATNITLVAVGNEIIATADRNLIARLVPAMLSLSAALKAAGFPQIRVSTPHSLGILSASEPPSAGRFRRGYDQTIFAPMLEFHRQTKTPFLVNPYPYFGYTPRTLNYALFRPNGGLFDAATGFNYTNMFEAQLDAVYSAMKKLGYGDVEIVVGETGWPSAGDPGQVGVSLQEAESYNRNLVQFVASGKGTALMPRRTFETYVFALFNENQKPGPTAERNFGLFNADFKPVYDVGLMRGGSSGSAQPSPAPGRAPSKWCVAKAGASQAVLQFNIDYACGAGGADCRPIQGGGVCFNPNTLLSHASYAMNAYYQVAGRHDSDCYFGGSGELITANPSHGSCLFQS